MTEILTKVVICGGACDPKCGKCGEPQIIPLTAEEIAQREADAKALAEQQAIAEAEAKAKAEAKASAIAKFAAMGLSDAEIAAIVA